jgi:hypothetical protein
MAFIYAGNHLRSHTLSRAVPSAQRGLTSVFGMGTGGTLAVWSPANLDAGRAARLKLEAPGGKFPAAEGSGLFLPERIGKLAPRTCHGLPRNRLGMSIQGLLNVRCGSGAAQS